MSLTVWAGVALLVLVNALYVAAEFGAVGVRRNRIRRMCDDGHWLARRLLPYVDDRAALDRYVSASQIGITVSSLMLGALAQATLSVALAPLVASWFSLAPVAAASTSFAIVLTLLTGVQVVIAELVPKAIALQYPTETALATVVPMQWSLQLFRPVIAFLNGFARFVQRLFGARVQGHGHLHSPEEIDLLIAESRDGGLLEPDEQQRLRRALLLSRRKARDLAVPLERLAMLRADATWDEIVRAIAASRFSRLPIYRETRERIIGTLRAKDVLERFVTVGPQPLEKLMRPVAQVREDVPADRVVSVLREQRAHQAVVTDGSGRAIGLLTIQDVLNELLGGERSAPGPGAPGAGGVARGETR